MMRSGCRCRRQSSCCWRLLLLCSIFIFSVSDASSANKMSYPASTQSKQNRRRGQSECSAPSTGCGYGLWNIETCECNCIPPYCSDDIYGACSTLGECPNAFEGCTPDVNCPYFNDLRGSCENGPNIGLGLYTVFWSLEECCEASYPDSSTCLPPTPPTASPSLAATDAPTKFPTAGAVLSPSDEPVSLTPISIEFSNLPSHFELHDGRREEMEGIIQIILTATKYDFNATISSLDIVDSIFSDEEQNELPLELQIEVTETLNVSDSIIHDAYLMTLHDHEDEIDNALRASWGHEVYPMYIILNIGGNLTASIPSNSEDGDIDETETATSNIDGTKKGIIAVVLIAIIFVTLCGGIFVWQRRRDKETDAANNSVWERRRDKSDAPTQRSNKMSGANGRSHISFFNHGESQRNQDLHGNSEEPSVENPASKWVAALNKMGFKKHQNDQKCGTDNKYCSSGLLNLRRNSSMSVSSEKEDKHTESLSRISGFSGLHLSRPVGQIDAPKNHQDSFSQVQFALPVDESVARIDQDPPGRVQRHPSFHQNHSSEDVDEQEEVEKGYGISNVDIMDDGYDGGKSSHIGDSKADMADDSSSSDESSSDDDDASDSSSEAGNVLGLLYYDGATSADESVDKSRISRRSRRTNRSSGKSSSGKSSKSRQSRRRTTRSITRQKSHPPVDPMATNTARQQQQQQQKIRDPDGLNQSHAKSSVKSDKFSGLVVNVDPGKIDEGEEKFDPNAKFTRSFVTNGSTILTEDSHRRAYIRENSSHHDSSTLTGLTSASPWKPNVLNLGDFA